MKNKIKAFMGWLSLQWWFLTHPDEAAASLDAWKIELDKREAILREREYAFWHPEVN